VIGRAAGLSPRAAKHQKKPDELVPSLFAEGSVMKRASHLAIAVIALTLVLGPAVLASDQNIALPAGTELIVRLTTTLSTRANQNGDPWVGQVMEPIFAGGREVVPSGSTVDGRVTYVKEAGRATGTGQMRLVAETITTPQEGTFTIVASLENAQGTEGTKVKGEEGTIEGPGKDKKGTIKEAGIDAAGGAAVGAIVHGGTGALYGAGIGAVAAVIHGLVKKHKGVVLPQGTELTFVLTRASLSKQVAPPRPETPTQ
jgi:hypothetical protein